MRKINKHTSTPQEVLEHLNERLEECSLDLWSEYFYKNIIPKIESSKKFLDFECIDYNSYLQNHKYKTMGEISSDEIDWTNFAFLRKWRNIKAQQRQENYAGEKFRIIFTEKAQTLIHRALFNAIYDFVKGRLRQIRNNWYYDYSTTKIIQTIFNIKTPIQVSMLHNFEKEPVNRQYPSLIELYTAIAYFVVSFGDIAVISLKSLLWKHLKPYFLIYPEDNSTLRDLIEISFIVMENLKEMYYFNVDRKEGELHLIWYRNKKNTYIPQK
ncbi:hypothetical protein [Mycoplasma sp. B6400]|uniref:hypothetical protein n=1 Tax=Mycoplasma sp. B6400 TaxID=3401674 RepID=UPI003AAA8469